MYFCEWFIARHSYRFRRSGGSRIFGATTPAMLHVSMAVPSEGPRATRVRSSRTLHVHRLL